MEITSKRYIKNCTGHSSASEKNQKETIISRILFYFLLFFFFGVLVYIILFSYFLQINNISISGTQELNNQELTQALEKSLDGNYLNFIPKNNFLFISKNKIEGVLTDNFKRIRSVSVEKKFPNSINISIDERKALLIWCINESDCFLIDENGTAYSQADFNSPELTQNNLLKIIDQSGAHVGVGEKIISADFEQYITSIKGEVGKLGLDITDEYLTPSRMSEEISVKTNQGTSLLFSSQFPLESASRTLSAILKKEIKKEQLPNVAYIDLRIENEAFYKLNEQSSQGVNEISSEGNEAQKKEDKKK